jgi:hypothetical protein
MGIPDAEERCFWFSTTLSSLLYRISSQKVISNLVSHFSSPGVKLILYGVALAYLYTHIDGDDKRALVLVIVYT